MIDKISACRYYKTMNTLKQYLKNNNIKIRQLQEESGLPYTTVNDIVNGRTEIDNASVKVLVAISVALKLSLDDTYALIRTRIQHIVLDEGKISVKGGRYYLLYKDSEILLCKVSSINDIYIKEIAEANLRRIKREEKMRAWS